MIHPTAMIGEGAEIAASVVIGAGVRIGARFRAEPGAVIGSEAFPERGAFGVVIGDDVSVGANTCIARGVTRDTEIGARTRIDNLVQIGHDVRIGADCMICGQAGIAGHAEIGERCIIGGRACIADHVRVGAASVITGNAAVASHVPPGAVMGGYPAMPIDQFYEAYKALRRLPRVLARI